MLTELWILNESYYQIQRAIDCHWSVSGEKDLHLVQRAYGECLLPLRNGNLWKHVPENLEKTQELLWHVN